MRLWSIASLLLAACGAPAAAPPANHAAVHKPVPTAPVTTAARRCLPVVSAECGCVYACGDGTRGPEGWRVAHRFWHDPLGARVDTWCVDGQCTEAFFATLVCDAVCTPRPADASCHLDDAGACVGASS